MKKVAIFFSLFLVLAFIVGCGPKVDYTPFAECLEEKGVIFYGAFWCSHCADQKAMFGEAKETLPYVECSLPDRSDQTQICKQQGIQSYPTWEFADGERESRVFSLEELSEKTGCSLPVVE